MKIILTSLFFAFQVIAINYVITVFVESEFNPFLWTVNVKDAFVSFAFALIATNLFSTIFAIFYYFRFYCSNDK